MSTTTIASRIASLAPALVVAAGLLLAVPALAAAADAAPPAITYGRFEPLVATLRPILATGFVLLGIGAVLMRVWRILTHSITHGADAAGNHPEPPSTASLGSFIFRTVAAVVVVIVLLYAGLDLINGIIAVIWSAGASPNGIHLPAGSPIPSPSVSVAP